MTAPPKRKGSAATETIALADWVADADPYDVAVELVRLRNKVAAADRAYNGQTELFG